MNEQITSAAHLDALPAGTVVKVHDDPTAPNSFWLKGGGGLWWTFAAGHGYTSDEMAESDWGFVVLYRPGEPQRVQPSQEDVARALHDEWADPEMLDGEGCVTCLAAADAVLALLPGRAEAEVKAEAAAEALEQASRVIALGSALLFGAMTDSPEATLGCKTALDYVVDSLGALAAEHRSGVGS